MGAYRLTDPSADRRDKQPNEKEPDPKHELVCVLLLSGGEEAIKAHESDVSIKPSEDALGALLLGFAVVDAHPDCEEIAVWLVSLIPGNHVAKTNAVLVEDRHGGGRRDDQLRALTRDRIVVETPGSGPLPEFIDQPSSWGLVLRFGQIVQQHQDAIIRSVDDFARQAKNRKLARPDFSALPDLDSFVPGKSAVLRALETAVVLEAVWRCWIESEDERVRRTVNPRTGKTPWMMPHELNDHLVNVLPGDLVSASRVQAVV